jgi:hypothetical protein
MKKREVESERNFTRIFFTQLGRAQTLVRRVPTLADRANMVGDMRWSRRSFILACCAVSIVAATVGLVFFNGSTTGDLLSVAIILAMAYLARFAVRNFPK